MSATHGPAPAALLERAAARWRDPASSWEEPLSFGIDLGTATLVLLALDATGEPVYLDSISAHVVRDGIVVDFHGAAEIVRQLRERAEKTLAYPVDAAATAYPPGIGPAESRACRHVLEQAGLSCTALVDEVTAAASLLGVSDGVVVDVGGGSTGVGVIVEGGIAQLGDLPGGGYHLDLILAGALGIPLEDAEILKRERGAEQLGILRPGLERVGASIARLSAGYEDLPVHLAGGALMIPGAADVVADYLGRPVVEYPHALYITPLGIARSAP